MERRAWLFVGANSCDDARVCGGIWIRWLYALTLGAASVACGEPGQIVVEEGEQAKAFCEASCTRGFECGSGGSPGACQRACEPDLEWLARYRPEAVQIIASCVREISCGSYFVEGSFEPCWDRAERELEPTRRLRSFCRSWSERWFECGSWYAVEACELDWVLYKGWFLERVLECTEGTCEALPGCTEAVVNIP
jgi:hypothetical protein